QSRRQGLRASGESGRGAGGTEAARGLHLRQDKGETVRRRAAGNFRTRTGVERVAERCKRGRFEKQPCSSGGFCRAPACLEDTGTCSQLTGRCQAEARGVSTLPY